MERFFIAKFSFSACLVVPARRRAARVAHTGSGARETFIAVVAVIADDRVGWKRFHSYHTRKALLNHDLTPFRAEPVQPNGHFA
ncbi:hypothetical protein [Gryllotalpicola daejeonensis]|uniref:hypothetical protein n=1 Tax=Gryllotalpicola daejeonensis TaxID=993087 RepID=UPI0031DCE2C6